MSRRTSLLLVLMLALIVTLAPTPTHAASITVNTTADEFGTGPRTCSLREAIQAANTNKPVGGCVAGSARGTDTIRVPAGIYVFIRRGIEEDANATGDLDITSSITLLGAGATKTIIDADWSDRVLHVQSSGTLRLERVTIRGGSTHEYGGGIFNAGTLRIVSSILRLNSAEQGGGGLATTGSATVHESTIDQNVGDHGGGGLLADFGGRLNVTRSTIARNRADNGRGGGVTVFRDGTATLVNVTVSGNRSGVRDDITDAGGVATASGTIRVQNSTIVNNTGGTGGVVGNVTLYNSIVARNVSDTAGGAPDCYGPYGPIASLGYNLIGNMTGCTLAGTTTGNKLNVDPSIGPLQNNGGATATHALFLGSPAIDAAAACPRQDQRNFRRPMDGNGDGKARCDIGAVERQSTTRP